MAQTIHDNNNVWKPLEMIHSGKRIPSLCTLALEHMHQHFIAKASMQRASCAQPGSELSQAGEAVGQLDYWSERKMWMQPIKRVTSPPCLLRTNPSFHINVAAMSDFSGLRVGGSPATH